MSITSIAVAIAQDTKARPLSALLEAACRVSGVESHRLRPTMVAVTRGDDQLIFSGGSGPSNSRVAHAVVRDPSWLHRLLRADGIPSVEALKVPIRSVDAAYDFLQRLGEPAEAWFRGEPSNKRIVDADSVKREWDAIKALQPKTKPADIILRPANLGDPKRATVAFGTVIASDKGVSHEEKALAVRALGALPAAAVAEVTYVQRPEESSRIASIDLSLNNWDVQPYREQAGAIALASLEGEIEAG
ncbi:hypothetical protein [Natronoglycomyces albus]|uniref:Uncharacterized protein n=1 Tax=Natronoglycomyces albus TaxID=2811108 RepID=A0A895XG29_9ACTN|nr:hypothetical protein [Natronoglycomyces albus]QSB04821.1 hypothetical protein JQS30_13765 [Natronoglycomyces albus]